MFKITSFTSHQTAEGERISFTYSEIDEKTGQLKRSNERANIILIDEEKIKIVNEFKNYLLEKIV
ncbi:MAG: hypothetical protein RR614_03110 [Eubacterium sp.]